jgi:glycosyltransferase involved in cell wall biosynthesis
MTLDLFGHEDREFGTSVRYFLSNLSAAQARRGHRATVHLLTSRSAQSYEVGQVAVHLHPCVQLPRRLDRKRRFGRQFSVGMVNALARGAYDVVHFHGLLNSHLMLAAVAWQTSRKQIPLVAQDQGERTGRRIERLAHRYGLRRVDAAIAGSAATADELRRSGIIDDVWVIGNGFDPQFFRPGSNELSDRRCDPLRVIVVSRLSAEKDPLTAADGIAAFANDGGRITVTFVGDGPLRSTIERRLRSCPAEVEFIRSHVAHDKLADLYRAADVLVLTSPREGSNQVVLEAMACGTPVVATDVPGIRDVVGDAAILIPARDPRAVAASLARVARDAALVATVRARGLRQATKFTWDEIAAQIDGVYTKVVVPKSEIANRKNS